VTEPLTFALPPKQYQWMFDELVSQVDWRPSKHAASPVPDGMVRATHTGVIQLTGQELRCYKLTTGENVFNAHDLAKLLGVSVAALTDKAKFFEERSRG